MEDLGWGIFDKSYGKEKLLMGSFWNLTKFINVFAERSRLHCCQIKILQKW
jgi:hypothetical protein